MINRYIIIYSFRVYYTINKNIFNKLIIIHKYDFYSIKKQLLHIKVKFY